MSERNDEPIRVLCIHRRRDVLRGITESLRAMDRQVDVSTAERVREGLTALTEDTDCIVCGYYLTGTSGLDFLRLIRAEFDDLPFFLITDDGSEALASEAISLGVTDYLRIETFNSDYDRFADSILRTVTARRRIQSVQSQYQDLLTLADRTRALPDAVRQLSAATSGRRIERLLTGIVRDDLSYPVAELFHHDDVDGVCRFRTDETATEGAATLVPDGDSLETGFIGWSTSPTTDPPGRALSDVPDPIRTAAEEAPVDNFVLLSLAYRSTVFGALLVGKENGPFEEDAIAVLETLVWTAGLARTRTNFERLLLADTVTELEFLIRDSHAFPVAPSAELDCAWTFEGIGPSERDTYCHRFSVRNAAVDDLRTVLENRTTIENYGVDTVAGSDDRCTVQYRASRSVFTQLLELGAAVRSARAESGRLRLAAETDGETNTRTLVERLTEAYPETELLAKRDRKRAVRSVEGSNLPVDELTMKQQSALRAAYSEGYYAWPRDTSSEEVADSLGVTAPTFLNHLRKAHETLVASCIERFSDE